MSHSFFEEFLYLTDIRTILFIGILFVLFYVMKRLEKKKINFSARMLIATGLGLLLGVVIQFVGGFPYSPLEVPFIREINTWYGLFANGFVSLLRMLVIPLILISMIRVIITMEKGVNLQKLTLRTVAMLIGTTGISALVGIGVAYFMQLGVNSNSMEANMIIREVESFVSILLSLIPSNPFESMASGEVVPVIIFAVFIGTATRRQMKKYHKEVKPFIDLIEAGYKIILSVTMTIIKLMPYAVIALLANTVASRGLPVIMDLLEFIVASYVAVAIMFVIHLIMVVLCGFNPIRYVRNVFDALVLSFTSRSSLGTLPVTIDNLTNKVGLNQGTSTFIGTLGVSGGMNGCVGVYPALVAVMLANMTGMEIDMTFIAMLVLVISMASFGTGLPGASTLALSVVLSGMGLGEFFPIVAGIVSIDPILDMGRTLLNVNGTLTTAVAVGKSLNQIDEDIFYGHQKADQGV